MQLQQHSAVLISKQWRMIMAKFDWEPLSAAEIQELLEEGTRLVKAKKKVEHKFEQNKITAQKLKEALQQIDASRLDATTPDGLSAGLAAVEEQLKEVMEVLGAKKAAGKRGRVAGTIRARKGENEEKILDALASGSEMSAKDIGTRTGISGIPAALGKMVAANQISRREEGEGKGRGKKVFYSLPKPAAMKK